jgi:integrase
MNPSRFSLFKRSNNIWYVRINGSSKPVWKSTRCTEKRAAQRFLSEYIALHQQEKSAVPLQPSSVPLKQFTKEFLEFGKFALKPRTIQIYKRTFEHFDKYFGNLDLDEITPKHWDQYLQKRGVDITVVSLHVEMRALKAAMNKAVQWGSIHDSPFQRVKNIKLAERPPKYFTKDEFRALLKLITEPWLYDAVIFAVATGIRRGELINLKWSDVSLERKVITIQSDQTFTVKAGKNRVVPLSPTALDVINRQQHIEKVPYVFTNNRKQIYGNWMSGLFRRYVNKAGFYGKGLHWHNLRSSFASWLVESGVSIYSVSRLLGHASVTLTQRYYANLSPDTMHSEVGKIQIF